MKLENKVIVVTGAGNGMGRELVLQLLQRGARVVGVDVNPATLQETAALAKDAQTSLHTIPTNIADRAAVEALPQATIARFGHVDGVINCAGIIQPFVRLTELDYTAIERVFDVNWRGTLYVTKAFLPLLLARPAAHIVNISSMGGFLPVPGQSIYGATKAAVKLFTEALFAELADTNVRVTVVFPGAVSTNIMANSGVALKHAVESGRHKIKRADTAAKEILDAVERDRFRVLVGSDAKLLDFAYRLWPRGAVSLIAKQMKQLLSP